MADQTQDPTQAEPTPPFPEQEQEPPGREADMQPLADHGEELLDHGQWGHCRSLFASTAWTPLLLRGPGVARGRRVPAAVQNLDVVPTVLDLLRVPAPAGLEGRSLRPLLAGEAAAVPAVAGAASDGRRFAFSSIGALRSIDDGSFTLITDLRSDEVRLFAATDPAIASTGTR